MPALQANPSPGVYIQEIPSGVRTITGVATSITAFIGRARRGPVNQPVVINNFSDFERKFGTLWSESTLSYAVRDFYLNGGSAAIIVRLYNPTQEGPNRVSLQAGAEDSGVLSLEAVSEGAWATRLQVTAQRPDQQFIGDIAEDLEVETTEVFNLIANDPTNGAKEVFNNVTVVESRRRIDRVLDNESNLLRVALNAEGEPLLPDNFLAPLSSEDPLSFLIPLEEEEEEEAVAEEEEEVETEEEAVAVAVSVASVDNLDGQVLTADNYITPDGGGTAAHLIDFVGSQSRKQGIFALEDADLVNLLCIPPFSFNIDVGATVWAAAAEYATRRRAMLLVDPPRSWNNVEDVLADDTGFAAISNQLGPNKKNAALFFPSLLKPDPILENQSREFSPCGTIAGVFSRTDSQRGVWKAPAGLGASLVGVPAMSVLLSDDENGQLNPMGVNCLRLRPAAGPVIWGSRTLAGNDQLASEWKYIPVRRIALFIEESLYRGSQWAVFEPNDEPLWAELRLNIGAFMQNLFRQGAFQGASPKTAYFVKCDSETTTQNDINLGIVNMLVGFAPLKPAEFVIIGIQQIAGQLQT